MKLDRVPWYGKDYGEPTGTCLPIEAHKIRLEFDEGFGLAPSPRVDCPGDCVEGDPDWPDNDCWLDTWVGELGWETIWSGPTLTFTLADAHGTAGEEGPSIHLTALVKLEESSR